MHGFSVYIRDILKLLLRVLPSFVTKFCYVSLFIFRLTSSQDCSILNIVVDSIENALSLHPSANIFVIGDFNAHHNMWLKHSEGIDIASVFHCPIHYLNRGLPYSFPQQNQLTCIST